MASDKTESIQKIVRSDPRFGPQAYYFIFDALDFTLQRLGNARHVTGVELLRGIRGYAIEQFGFLAHTVLIEWEDDDDLRALLGRAIARGEARGTGQAGVLTSAMWL